MKGLVNTRWQPIGYFARPTWEATAEQLKLTFEPGTVHDTPVIYGRIDGYYLEVTCTDDRPGAPTPATRYAVEYVSGSGPITIGPDSVLKRSVLGRRIAKINDVQIGDADFDKAASIDAPSVEAAQEFLTERRRRVIGCLLYTSPSPRDQRGSRMPSSA